MDRELEFESCCEQFMPMVYSLIKKWHLGREREEFEQIGRIAIYEAWINYDASVGEFSSYVAGYVRGRMKDVIKRQDRWGTRHVFTEPVKLAEHPDLTAEDRFLMEDWLEHSKLTSQEKMWVMEGLIDGYKLQEIAVRYGRSVTTIKTWRQSALQKLRTKLSYIVRE